MDERLKRIKCDAKLRSAPKQSRKVKIDNRFQSMFKDDKFKQTSKIDARGRPVKHDSTKDLRQFYHQSSSEDSSSDEEPEEEKKDETSTDKNLSDEVKKKLKNLQVDYARGEQTLLESSSDDEDSEGEVSDAESIEHKWGELDADAGTTEEMTNRLAICNMDWDRIKADDIMVLLNSFLPPGGVIESVDIYVSEFGKQRLAEEDVTGPPELRETVENNTNTEIDEGSSYHMEKLRQYQLNRLKYYYAVVTFNNENAANKVYTECDGMEYESSAVKLDLRIIPKDMEFDDEPKDTCKQMPTKYHPKYFITSALQQAKVNLTWDETNPDRIELTEKINSGKLAELDENVLKNFIASSEDESDQEDVEERAKKYRDLFKEIENNTKKDSDDEADSEDKDKELEVTWDIRKEEKAKELVEKKQSEKDDKTPFEKYLEKKKEKRKLKKKQKKGEDSDSDIPSDIDMNDPYFAEEFNKSELKKKDKKKKSKKDESENEEDIKKRAELELLLADDKDDKKHFSLKKIQESENPSKKSKRKKKNKETKEVEDDGFKFDVDDPRFQGVYTSHLYNIDPSHPSFKKTKGMEALITEKLKRKAEADDQETNKKMKIDKGVKKDAELGVLVKNLKRKTKDMLKNK